MTDEDKIVKSMLANEEMDRVAHYLSRGRPLQSLDEPTLKRLWIDKLRQQLLHEGSGASASSDDISAELSLRGIKVELPPDLKAAIQSDAVKTKRALELYPEFGENLLNWIAEFERALAKPKN